MFIGATFVGILLYFITVVNGDCGVIPRADWGASAALTVDYLPLPVDLVVLEHTNTVTCLTFDSCSRITRRLQTIHMEQSQRRATDIKFNFVVGGNGQIFEGRGWLHSGSDLVFPQRAVTIAFTGENNVNPTNLSIEAVKTLLSCGVENGHLAADYHMLIRRYPGDLAVRKIHAVASQWPHYLLRKNLPPIYYTI